MIQIVFWLSAAYVLYVYAGYPALLLVWARLSRRASGAAAIHPELPEDPACPGISIVIAGRNEAARLPQRIANLLSIEYPADRRQIIVVSDGSTDDTAAALRPFGDRIDLVPVPEGGKAAALNAGVKRARHEILVFTDARQTFAADALRALIAPFANPRVGGVTGELLLGSESGGRRDGTADRRGNLTSIARADTATSNRRATPERRAHLASSVAEGVGLYWRYEKALRRLESDVDSTLGATGAIYALRRSLWTPLPTGTILDDVLAPMRAVLAGWRIVFEERAQAFDFTAPDSSAEAQRKVRTLAGNFQILALEPRLLMPGVNRVWLQYISHKVGRLFVPYALVTLLVSTIILARQHVLYLCALVAQGGFYLLAAYGGWLERRRRSATLPATNRGSIARNIGQKDRVADA